LNLQAYTYHLWELASGKERLTFANPETVYNWYSEQIAFAPDGRSFATALADKTIRILDTATGNERLRRSGYEASVRSLAFAPGGKSLASGHADSTILLWDLTPELSQRAPAAKASAEELEIWWTDLAGPDTRKAHAAIWSLAALSQQAVPLLRDRLCPAAAVPADRLRQLLADLDSKQSKSREAASKQLAELEEQAESSLQEALNAKPSPEKRRRIEALLAAPRIVRSPETLRHLRAVEVLELSNSPEAPPILETLANGAPEARLTQEAKATLKRLARQRTTGP
jgi:hypothetical protein